MFIVTCTTDPSPLGVAVALFKERLVAEGQAKRFDVATWDPAGDSGRIRLRSCDGADPECA